MFIKHISSTVLKTKGKNKQIHFSYVHQIYDAKRNHLFIESIFVKENK